MAAAVEAKARPPQAPHRLIKEGRKVYLFFQSEKGQTAFQESLLCLSTGMNWICTWVTRTHTHTHWQWSISVSYSKWFLNERIELYILGMQAKVFWDYIHLQRAGYNLCSRYTFIVLFCTVYMRVMSVWISGVKVTGVSRFITTK